MSCECMWAPIWRAPKCCGHCSLVVWSYHATRPGIAGKLCVAEMASNQDTLELKVRRFGSSTMRRLRTTLIEGAAKILNIFRTSTSPPTIPFFIFDKCISNSKPLSTFKRGILTKETSSVFLEDSPSCRKSLSPECARTSNNFSNTPTKRKSETSSRPSNFRSASRIMILSVTSVSLVPSSCQRCRGRTWPSGTIPQSDHRQRHPAFR